MTHGNDQRGTEPPAGGGSTTVPNRDESDTRGTLRAYLFAAGDVSDLLRQRLSGADVRLLGGSPPRLFQPSQRGVQEEAEWREWDGLQPGSRYLLIVPSVEGFITPTKYSTDETGSRGMPGYEMDQWVAIPEHGRRAVYLMYYPDKQADAQLEAAVDVTAYPILNQPVSFDGVPGLPGAAPAAGTASVGQTAENALREVLNWRPRASDASGFSNALAQSFTLNDVEGHTEWKWTPRSYTVQTDLGAVTGAQASLYTRAKVALDQSLPLIEGLQPLIDVFPEDLDSMRVVIRDSLSHLVNEFGLLGGPRIARVDELFVVLLGEIVAKDAPQTVAPDMPRLPRRFEEIGGQLARLRDRFGLERLRVNTVDDEQNYTNFLILTDYIIALGQSWIAQRPYFIGARHHEPFLGTQLVLLSRDLEVVSELVQAAYFTMDSVLIGPAQRQTIKLDFGSEPGMFLADLLDWVNRVATEEGPRLIQAAGKDGIFAFLRTINDLETFVEKALVTHPGSKRRAQQKLGGTIPAAYGTARVQRALESLLAQLRETQKDAEKIRPPVIGDTERQREAADILRRAAENERKRDAEREKERA